MTLSYLKHAHRGLRVVDMKLVVAMPPVVVPQDRDEVLFAMKAIFESVDR